MANRSEMSSQALLDIGTLESLALLGERRGKDLLGQLVGLFADQGPASIDKLRKALAAADAVGVQETAHSLKGSYRSLGTSRLAAISEEIETRGRQNQLEGLHEWLDDLEQAFGETHEALNSFLAERRAQVETS